MRLLATCPDVPQPTAADLRLIYETGFWFCLACQKIIEPVDPGEPWASCPRCGSRRIKWCPPADPRTGGRF